MAALQGADGLSTQVSTLGQVLLAQASGQTRAPKHLSKREQRRHAYSDLAFLSAGLEESGPSAAPLVWAILAGWRVPAKRVCARLCTGLSALFLVLTTLIGHKCRRVATRYEKRAVYYLAMVPIAAILLWL